MSRGLPNECAKYREKCLKNKQRKNINI